MMPNERLKGGKVVKVLPSGEMHREQGNTGVFSELPERMSKKHIREVAKQWVFILMACLLL